MNPGASAWEPVPPAADAVDHYLIWLAEPPPPSQTLLGNDLATEPVRRATLERARDEAAPIATPPIVLPSVGQVRGVLLALPIYASADPPPSASERRATLRGFALAAFRINALVDRSLARFPSDEMELSIEDPGAPPGARQVYGQSPSSTSPSVPEAVRITSFGGREWKLHFRARPSWVVRELGTGAWAVLASGLGFSGLLGAFLLVTTGRTARIEQLVAERTCALSDAVADLRAANEELEAFSYTVSHDLRAPLRAIDGFSSLLAEDHAGQLNPEGRRLLGVIRASVQRMGALSDDLLAFSRAGRQPLHTVEVNMEQLARTVFQELSMDEPPGAVTFTVGSLPSVAGDPALLRQVWINLLGNALKFTRPVPDRRISVEGWSNGGCNHYVVRDNGVGFDMAFVDKIFGVFERLHPASQFPGTGVGLAIVERIVRRHGGRVRAEGAPGEGASFAFVLPSTGTLPEPGTHP
jgi:signal transduction histidine kinase